MCRETARTVEARALALVIATVRRSEMKQINEDYAFEQRRQARIDAEDSTKVPQWHQKVGTVIPFSRTVDRDPNPRIPLSVPERLPAISKTEAAFWVTIVGLWLVYLAFGPGAW